MGKNNEYRLINHESTIRVIKLIYAMGKAHACSDRI